MIIDTFPFNRDFNALEIRYEELKHSVDLFIASESAFTHSGLSKELHLTNAGNIRKMMGDKLLILASRKRPLTNNSRTREMLQRQQITDFIRTLRLSPSDLIIHSDCDEIPRATVVEDLNGKNSVVDAVLELDNYANYLNAKDGIWPRGRIVSFSRFRSIQHMRADIFIHKASQFRRHQLPFMRLTDFWSSKRFPFNALPELVKVKNLEVIPNAGWHFNNLIEESEIIQKIESSCHVEWNTQEVRVNALNNYRNASDIYTGVKHEIVEVNESYPFFIQNNIDKWQSFIYKNE
jgi:hypothetical protein